MKIQIKSRFNRTIIFETDAESLGGAILTAIKSGANLSNANLSGANLSGANLSGANLSYANLSYANLSGANLYGANLYGANLSDANLSGANLSYANLSGASLSGANLSNATLYGANLSGANLSGANLSYANLSYANLSGANLSNATLYGANLSDANLSGANLSGAKMHKPELDTLVAARTIVPEEGSFIGWKKLAGGIICKLKIPSEAKRVGGLIGRKCRAEFVMVLEGAGHTATYGPMTHYTTGETTKPDRFNPDPTIECSHGIHFFITRSEAEKY